MPFLGMMDNHVWSTLTLLILKNVARLHLAKNLESLFVFKIALEWLVADDGDEWWVTLIEGWGGTNKEK